VPGIATQRYVNGCRKLRVVIVRRARHEDLEASANAVAAVAEEDFLGAQPPVDIEDRVERFRELIERGDPTGLWVLEDEHGQVVGHAAVQESVPGVLSLGMAILPRARGRGGGRALVSAVQAHARSCSAHKISLEVWTDNARAIALYAATGFEVEGLRRDHYRRRDGRLRSTLLMAWHADNAEITAARTG
jgi:putative acetyltransferase